MTRLIDVIRLSLFVLLFVISLLIYHYSLFVIRYRYSVFIRDIVIRLHAYSLLYSFTHLYCVSFKYHYSFFIFVYKHYLVLMLVYSYSTSRGWRILVQLEGARWRYLLDNLRVGTSLIINYALLIVLGVTLGPYTNKMNYADHATIRVITGAT